MTSIPHAPALTQTRIPTLTTLDEMVADSELKYPALFYKTPAKRRKERSRAYAAGQLVEQRNVTFWGEMPISLRRLWIVGDHEVYFDEGLCTCRDNGSAPQAGKWRLCKHVLAVRYWLRMRSELVELLGQHFNAALEAGIEEITLFPQVYFIYNERRHGGVQENVLHAMRIGATKVEFPLPIKFTLGDLTEVLLSSRWHVTGRVGGAGYGSREHWQLSPGLATDHRMNDKEITGVWKLDFQSQEAAARKGRELKFGAQFQAHLNAQDKETS